MATIDVSLFNTSPSADLFSMGSLRLADPEYDAEGFDSILNILPIVRVEQHDGIITVGGFWAKDLAEDIRRNWGSARVSNNIFMELNSRSFKCYEFFALEVDYILTYLMENAPKVRTSKSSLASIRDALREKTWLSEIETGEPRHLNMKALDRLTLSPLVNQREFLDVIANRTTRYKLNGQVLGSPPGTGKTLTGFMTSLALDADMTLFIVPRNTVEEVWVETLENKFKTKPSYWTSLSGKMPTGKEEFLVCHYEFLVKLEPVLRMLQKKKRLCIWIDESHHFNELRAKRTQFLIDMVDYTQPINVTWASGTPFKAMGSELAPILRTIDPLFTERVMADFVAIFGATKARAIDILRHRIEKFTYRIDKKKVVDIKEIPVKNVVKIPDPKPFLLTTVKADLRKYVEERVTYYKGIRRELESTYLRLLAKASLRMPPSAHEELETYKRFNAKMHKEFSPMDDMDKIKFCKNFEENYIYPVLSNEDKKEYKYVISRHRTLILVVRGEALGNVLVKRRIACFKAMIPHANLDLVAHTARKKVMYFTSYVETAKEMHAQLEKQGINAVLVIGETNTDFERIIQQFKRDDRVKAVVATYKSLSTGVPVTEASDVFLLDVPFRDYILDQTKSRAIRIGQDGPVRVTTTELDTGEEGNLSTRNLDIMKWSKEAVDQMLGIDSGIDDADTFDAAA